MARWPDVVCAFLCAVASVVIAIDGNAWGSAIWGLNTGLSIAIAARKT